MGVGQVNDNIFVFAFCICICIAYIFFTLPLGIVSVYLSELDNTCHVEAVGMNISKYLFIDGIVSIIVALIMMVLIILYSVKEIDYKYILVISSLNTIFGLIWCIIGGMVIFKSREECAGQATVQIVYSLVLWSLSLATCFMTRL